MATKKVVQELITKWKYQVDATQIKKTASLIRGLKKNFSEVRKTSTAFGKGEFARINRIKKGWMGLNRQVDGYRRNLVRTSTTRGGGGRGGGRGRGGGTASLGQSGAFLAGRMAGSSALTSALLGGGGLAGAFAGGAAIRQAGRRETAEASFTSLLGGKGKGEGRASEMLNAVNQMAVKTPFNISDLRDLTSESLAGGFGQEEVLPMMSMLGDVTQGKLPKLKRMLSNMVEIRNTGRANLRDIRQFGRAGVPIYEALNAVMGTTGKELGEMITKGKVGLPQVTAALKYLTGEGGKFNNYMADVMDTLLGKVSNLGDAFEIAGEKAGGPMLGMAKKAVDGLMKGIEVATPHLSNFATGVSEIFQGFMDFLNESPILMGFIKGIGIALALAMVPIMPITAALVALFLVVEDIGTAFAGGESYFGDMMKGLEWFQEIDWSGGFTKGLDYMLGLLKSVGAWFAESALGKMIISGMDAVGTHFSEGFKNRAPATAPMGIGMPGTVAAAGGANSLTQNTSINLTNPDQIPGVLSTVNSSNLDFVKSSKKVMSK